ncbi:hypothetical protein D3C75_1252260 [compost metagenome]
MFGVINKSMADASSSRKTDTIARLQRVKMTVNPHLRMPFENISELFFTAFGVGIRGTATRQQAFVMNPQAC